MRSLSRLIALGVGVVLSLSALVSPAAAAVFQYRVPVAQEKGEAEAFLWIPAEARQIRGVLFMGMTLAEREASKDPAVRAACAEQQLAIVFMKCGLASTDLQKVLDDLAKTSGYRELSVAPLFFVGHSAGGPQAKEMAVKYADRCFGLMQYRGGGPYDGAPVPANVPCVMMMGNFDEYHGVMRNAEGQEAWERTRNALADARAKNNGSPWSLAVEPGAGHFSWSERNGKYFALFLKKAAAARIPATWPIDSTTPPALNPVDVEKGWLTDLSIRTAGNPPAPVATFAGDKLKAAWHFDEEMARATVAYHQGVAAKKDQFIKWNDPYWVDAGTRFFFTQLKWVDDGQTLQVSPAYADQYPGQYDGKGPKWLEAGKPVGKSAAPIKVKLCSGPLEVVGPDKLRIKFDGLTPATEVRATFMAYSDGDAEYRYTEIPGMLPRGMKGLTDGKPQTITFDQPADLTAAGVPLKATSDAGLPVEFYVAYGPAVIENGQLKLAELPARATFPVEVKVVAYQFGKGNEPKVKTAAAVERVVKVTK